MENETSTFFRSYGDLKWGQKRTYTKIGHFTKVVLNRQN